MSTKNDQIHHFGKGKYDFLKKNSVSNFKGKSIVDLNSGSAV